LVSFHVDYMYVYSVHNTVLHIFSRTMCVTTNDIGAEQIMDIGLRSKMIYTDD